jgi:hypothetical protein
MFPNKWVTNVQFDDQMTFRNLIEKCFLKFERLSGEEIEMDDVYLIAGVSGRVENIDALIKENRYIAGCQRQRQVATIQFCLSTGTPILTSLEIAETEARLVPTENALGSFRKRIASKLSYDNSRRSNTSLDADSINAAQTGMIFIRIELPIGTRTNLPILPSTTVDMILGKCAQKISRVGEVNVTKEAFQMFMKSSNNNKTVDETSLQPLKRDLIPFDMDELKKSPHTYLFCIKDITGVLAKLNQDEQVAHVVEIPNSISQTEKRPILSASLNIRLLLPFGVVTNVRIGSNSNAGTLLTRGLAKLKALKGEVGSESNYTLHLEVDATSNAKDISADAILGEIPEVFTYINSQNDHKDDLTFTIKSKVNLNNEERTTTLTQSMKRGLALKHPVFTAEDMMNELKPATNFNSLRKGSVFGNGSFSSSDKLDFSGSDPRKAILRNSVKQKSSLPRVSKGPSALDITLSLPDGHNLVNRFSGDDSIKDIRAYVKSNVPKLGDIFTFTYFYSALQSSVRLVDEDQIIINILHVRESSCKSLLLTVDIPSFMEADVDLPFKLALSKLLDSKLGLMESLKDEEIYLTRKRWANVRLAAKTPALRLMFTGNLPAGTQLCSTLTQRIIQIQSKFPIRIHQPFTNSVKTIVCDVEESVLEILNRGLEKFNMVDNSTGGTKYQYALRFCGRDDYLDPKSRFIDHRSVRFCILNDERISLSLEQVPVTVPMLFIPFYLKHNWLDYKPIQALCMELNNSQTNADLGDVYAEEAHLTAATLCDASTSEGDPFNSKYISMWSLSSSFRIEIFQIEGLSAPHFSHCTIFVEASMYVKVIVLF